MFEVWTINGRGVYELFTSVESGVQAGLIAKGLKKRGMWAQVCKHGENNINGASR